MNRLLAIAAFSAAAWLAPTGVATAAVRCAVDNATDMDFGRPGQPIDPVATTAQVTVTCDGNKRDAGEQVLVCVGLYDNGAGREMPRDFFGFFYRLGYGIYRDPAHQQPMNFTINAFKTLTIGPNGTPVTADLILYGQLDGQQGLLTGGNYRETVPAAMGWSTTPGASCDTVAAMDNFDFVSRAELFGQCTIQAEDLVFGSASDLSAGNVDAATAIRVSCTPRTLYRISLDGGGSGDIANRRMVRQGGGSEFVDYDLYLDPGRTRLWGNGGIGEVATGSGDGMSSADVHTVYGRVPAQPTPLAGDYRDVVTATVVY